MKKRKFSSGVDLSDTVKRWAGENPAQVEKAIEIFSRFPETRSVPAKKRKISELFSLLAFNTPGDISDGIDRSVSSARIALEEWRRENPKPGRGGHRPGASRPKKLEGGAYTPTYLDEETRDLMLELGSGNKSEGIRRAGRIIRALQRSTKLRGYIEAVK
jgi:hypothetical protein